MSNEQVSHLGLYEDLDMTDTMADQIISSVRDLPEFTNFTAMNRSGKYIICRKSIPDLAKHQDDLPFTGHI